MRNSVLYVTLGLLFFTSPTWSQPVPPLLKKGEELVPTARPNFVYRATAAEVDDKVVIRLSSPSLRLTGKKDAQNVSLGVYVWEDNKPLTLGKEVKAYSQAGKTLSKEAVLKALAKQVPVVHFVRRKRDDPELPDPFYMVLFRDDTVLLVLQGQHPTTGQYGWPDDDRGKTNLGK
ncbi:MAG: hypothetical protein ACRELF_04715 [Gemmataceae bacterium]